MFRTGEERAIQFASPRSRKSEKERRGPCESNEMITQKVDGCTPLVWVERRWHGNGTI